MIKLAIALLFALSMTCASSHELDIAGPVGFPLYGSVKFKPDQSSITSSRDGNTEVNFILSKNKKLKYFNINEFSMDSICEKSTQENFEAKVKFSNQYFEVQNDWNQAYELTLKGECGKSNSFIFNYDSFAGQVIGIFNVAQKAVLKFNKIGKIDFWNAKIKMVYPGDGDYYSYRMVNVTKGHYWDVVGHELGHAIYDMANIGMMGAGNHRIDECYTERLAFSEGWASFFSAWLSVDLNDSNAQFEYMVPRRAPLQIENIPGDVCKGPGNEWRVYTFLWDIIDTHQDSEVMNELFSSLWDFSLNKMFTSIVDFKNSMEDAGFDPVLLNITYKNNIN